MYARVRGKSLQHCHQRLLSGGPGTFISHHNCSSSFTQMIFVHTLNAHRYKCGMSIHISD